MTSVRLKTEAENSPVPIFGYFLARYHWMLLARFVLIWVMICKFWWPVGQDVALIGASDVWVASGLPWRANWRDELQGCWSNPLSKLWGRPVNQSSNNVQMV